MDAFANTLSPSRGTCERPRLFVSCHLHKQGNLTSTPQRYPGLKPTLLPRSTTHVRAGKTEEGKQKPAFRLQWPELKTSRRKGKEPSQPPPDDSWGWFDWAAYEKKFEVPWGGGVLALGMGGWVVSTVTVGVLFIPQAIRWFGYTSYSGLTNQQAATLLLVTQAVETVVGVSVVYLVTQHWRPFPSDLFKISFQDPFKRPVGWLAWGGFGLCMSVFVNVALSSVLYAAGITEMGGRGTVDTVLNMVTVDWRSYLSLITVVGVLAPVLEETVFRGFLLTTLTKWMPTPVAVAVSSLAFGFAHFSPKDLPFLVGVGMVWGFMYVRSKNLLTPMIMHGCWNSAVLTILFGLASAGVDIQQLI